MTFQEVIKRLQVLQGEELKQLAGETGIHLATLYRIRKGDSGGLADTVDKIREALKQP